MRFAIVAFQFHFKHADGIIYFLFLDICPSLISNRFIIQLLRNTALLNFKNSKIGDCRTMHTIQLFYDSPDHNSYLHSNRMKLGAYLSIR